MAYDLKVGGSNEALKDTEWENMTEENFKKLDKVAKSKIPKAFKLIKGIAEVCTTDEDCQVAGSKA